MLDLYTDKIHVRWMIRRDLPEVLQNEQAAFDDPWSEEDFLTHLRRRNMIGMVAELGETKDGFGRIVGHMIYELHRSQLYLVNLCVAPAFQRQGIGTTMILRLISKLSTHRRTKISIVVPESNLPALQFLRKKLFLSAGLIRNHFEHDGDDGIRMEYEL